MGAEQGMELYHPEAADVQIHQKPQPRSIPLKPPSLAQPSLAKPPISTKMSQPTWIKSVALPANLQNYGQQE